METHPPENMNTHKTEEDQNSTVYKDKCFSMNVEQLQSSYYYYCIRN